MKNYILLLLSITFSFSGCKKTEDNPPLEELSLIPAASQPAAAITASDFSLSVSDTVSIADGTRLSVIKATLGTPFRGTYKTVNFSVGPVGVFLNAAKTYTATFDINGEAIAYLSSPNTGLAIVSAELPKGPVKTIRVTFNPPVPVSSADFNIIRSDSVSTADGASLIAVKVTLSQAFRETYKSVTFLASPIGSFAAAGNQQTVSLDINGEATVYVSSASTGMANISAQLSNGPAKYTTIHYKTALPEQLFLEPSVATFAASYSSSALVTARLLRKAGTPSPNLKVFYYDSTSANTSIGTFFNTTLSNASGESTATYALTDSTFHGFVYLKAYVLNGNIRIPGTNRIYIP